MARTSCKWGHLFISNSFFQYRLRNGKTVRICKICHLKRCRESRKKHIDRVRKTAKIWYAKNKEYMINYTKRKRKLQKEVDEFVKAVRGEI